MSKTGGADQTTRYQMTQTPIANMTLLIN
ncbi:IS66 family insertion sequence hypothetical protein, partial [Vibrio anguillarum]